MFSLDKYISLAIGVCLIISPVANSIEKHTNREMKPGWHGSFGLSFANIKLKGANVALLDSDSNIQSLDDSVSLKLSTPIPLLTAGYVFQDGRTEIFFGNSNSFSNEGSGALGVRYELDNQTLLSMSYDESSYGNQILQDPFETNVNRNYIDADSRTFNIGAESIFGSAISITYSYGKLDIKDDLSGQSLSPKLNLAELKSLQRSSTKHDFEISYFIPISNKLIIFPSISYKKTDAEGGAESYSQVGLTSTLVYFYNKFQFYVNIGFTKAQYEKENPVFSSRRADKSLILALGVEYSEPFGMGDTHFNFDIANMKTDSNIQFYESKLEFVSLGMTYDF